jgi:hypothetical protein
MFICAGSEILTQVKDHDLEVVEIPITARYDIENTSTKNPVSHGVGVHNPVIGLIAEKRPLVYIGLPGFISFVIGVFLRYYCFGSIIRMDLSRLRIMRCG